MTRGRPKNQSELQEWREEEEEEGIKENGDRYTL